MNKEMVNKFVLAFSKETFVELVKEDQKEAQEYLDFYVKNDLGADLSGVNLSGVNLNGFKFRGVRLVEADLSQASLKKANLKRTDLKGANLSKVNAWRANFSDADLHNATLDRGCFSEGNFTRANLSDISATYAGFDAARFFGATLCRASLVNTTLTDASIRVADLSDADISEAKLGSVDLYRSSLDNIKGFVNPMDFMANTFEKSADGYVVYTTCAEELTPGTTLERICNMDPQCCEYVPVTGIHCWDQENATFVSHYKDENLYKVLIRWEWLLGVCVPYSSFRSGIRCSKVEVLDKLE